MSTCPVCGNDTFFGPATIMVPDGTALQYVDCKRCHTLLVVGRDVVLALDTPSGMVDHESAPRDAQTSGGRDHNLGSRCDVTHRTTAPATPSVPTVDCLVRFTATDSDGQRHTITAFSDEVRALCEQLALALGGSVDYES